MTTKELAQRIARDLFVNGQGQTAMRLRLELPGTNGRPVDDGGAYCFVAVVDRIKTHLDENIFWKLE